MAEEVLDPCRIVNRHLFRRRQQAVIDLAFRGSRRAAREGDFRAQAKLLSTALNASKSLAAAYGVQVKPRAEHDGTSTDAEAVAAALVRIAASHQKAEGLGAEEDDQ